MPRTALHDARTAEEVVRDVASRTRTSTRKRLTEASFSALMVDFVHGRDLLRG